MKKLQVHFTRNPDDSWLVGTLAEERGRTYFEYAPEFFARGINLSPFRLPFGPELLNTKIATLAHCRDYLTIPCPTAGVCC